MNRRMSMLCLTLMAAAGMLFATSAPAAEVDFDIANHGVWYATGFPISSYPVFEVYTIDEVAPNPFGITRMRVYLKANYVTREIWDGRDIYLTDDGDALFTRFKGHLAYADVPQTLTQEFVGGTGIFAGVRGTATHVCYPEFTSPVHGPKTCESHGTLLLADLKSKMVPMVSTEGDLVSLEVQHVETEAWGLPPLPFLAQKVAHIGEGDHLGLYGNSECRLLDLNSMGFFGFFTRTAAGGDTMHGYYEGSLSPPGGDPQAVDMQVWITGGTGRFVNASGKQTGAGLWWSDGREEITLEGAISSVGSSKK